MGDGQMVNKLTKLITKWSVVPRANLGRNIVGKQLPTMLRPFSRSLSYVQTNATLLASNFQYC